MYFQSNSIPLAPTHSGRHLERHVTAQTGLVFEMCTKTDQEWILKQEHRRLHAQDTLVKVHILIKTVFQIKCLYAQQR